MKKPVTGKINFCTLAGDRQNIHFDNQKGKKIYFTVWPQKKQKTLAKLVFSYSTADEVLYIYQNPPQSIDCARQKKKELSPS